MLIEVVARHDLRFRKSALIENSSGLDAQEGKIAGIQPNPYHLVTLFAQSFANSNRRLDSVYGVIGINEEYAIVGHGLCIRVKGLLLAIERHYPAVRVGSPYRDSVTHSREDIRGGCTSADMRRATRRHGAIDPLRPPQAEFQDGISLRRLANPCGLGRN